MREDTFASFDIKKAALASSSSNALAIARAMAASAISELPPTLLPAGAQPLLSGAQPLLVEGAIPHAIAQLPAYFTNQLIEQIRLSEKPA